MRYLYMTIILLLSFACANPRDNGCIEYNKYYNQVEKSFTKVQRNYSSREKNKTKVVNILNLMQASLQQGISACRKNKKPLSQEQKDNTLALGKEIKNFKKKVVDDMQKEIFEWTRRKREERGKQ